jgi:hypothetical protein
MEELFFVYVETNLKFTFYLTECDNVSNQINRIKKNYLYFYKIVQQELKHCDQSLSNYNTNLSQYLDQIILVLLSQWDGLYSHLSAHIPKVPVLIVSSKGEIHLRTLVNLLKNQVGTKIEISSTNASYFEITPKMIKEYVANNKLIISNEWFPILPEEKLFVVDDFPCDNQIFGLRKIIENIQYKMIKESQKKLFLSNLS